MLFLRLFPSFPRSFIIFPSYPRSFFSFFCVAAQSCHFLFGWAFSLLYICIFFLFSFASFAPSVLVFFLRFLFVFFLNLLRFFQFALAFCFLQKN
jgi:hypothetical protein